MPSNFHYFSIPFKDSIQLENILLHCREHQSIGFEEFEDNGSSYVKAYFDSQTNCRAAAEYFQQSGHQEVRMVALPRQDWNAEWRKQVQPIKLCKGHWVSPPWRPPRPAEGERWIRLEPRMAFGTGHHETTQLAAESLYRIKNALKNSILIDVGTGSGILCLLGQSLKASITIGIENDWNCFDNLVENRANNAGLGTPNFILGTLKALRHGPISHHAVINMIWEHSSPILSALSCRVKTGGRLIWTGLLHSEKHRAKCLAQNIGLSLLSEQEKGEWWCGIFEKTD